VKKIILAQLTAAQASIDAAYALLEGWGNGPPEAAPEPSPEAGGICLHLEAKRKDISTMGRAAWMCQECGFIHEEGGGDA
jgi:hypothetical protein